MGWKCPVDNLRILIQFSGEGRNVGWFLSDTGFSWLALVLGRLLFPRELFVAYTVPPRWGLLGDVPPSHGCVLSEFWGRCLCWHCDACTCEVVSGPGPQLARLAGVLIKDVLVLLAGCAGPTAAHFSLSDHLWRISTFSITFFFLTSIKIQQFFIQMYCFTKQKGACT